MFQCAFLKHKLRPQKVTLPYSAYYLLPRETVKLQSRPNDVSQTSVPDQLDIDADEEIIKRYEA